VAVTATADAGFLGPRRPHEKSRRLLRSGELVAKQLGRRERSEKLPAGATYFFEGRDSAAVDHNLRQMFAEAIEREAQEVLRYLHNVVWPFYGELYWQHHSTTPEDTDEWMGLQQLIRSAVLELGGIGTRLSTQPLVIELANWADRFGIRVEWILQLALDVMAEWSRTSGPDYEADISSMLSMVGAAPLSDWAADRAIYRWSAGRIWTTPAPAVFEYKGQGGAEDADAYVRQRLRDFEDHLRKKVVHCAPTPAARPSDFDLLALYVCKGWSIGQIAQWLSDNELTGGRSIDDSTVLRRIKHAGQLVGMRTRSPGRPRKK
jgi:hypothetical protein